MVQQMELPLTVPATIRWQNGLMLSLVRLILQCKYSLYALSVYRSTPLDVRAGPSSMCAADGVFLHTLSVDRRKM